MGKQEEMIKLDRIIKDTELRLLTFKTNLNTVQKEIDLLEKLEEQLEENIKYLKNAKIIAMAAEYKKSKENLKKTKNRLLQLRIDKENHRKVDRDLEVFLRKNKEEYVKLSNPNQNNVVKGKFGKSNV